MLGLASKVSRLGRQCAGVVPRQIPNASSSMKVLPATSTRLEGWRRHQSSKPTIAPKNEELRKQLLTFGEYCAEVMSLLFIVQFFGVRCFITINQLIKCSSGASQVCPKSAAPISRRARTSHSPGRRAARHLFPQRAHECAVHKVIIALLVVRFAIDVYSCIKLYLLFHFQCCRHLWRGCSVSSLSFRGRIQSPVDPIQSEDSCSNLHRRANAYRFHLLSFSCI